MARPRSADDANKSGPQRLVALVRSSFPPMHPAGLPFVSAASRSPRWAAGIAGCAAPGWPRRAPTRRSSGIRRAPAEPPGVVVAPADGWLPGREAEPPAELACTRPAAPGQHLPVDPGRPCAARPDRRRCGRRELPGRSFPFRDLAEASADNERNSVLIRTPEGQDVVAVQIAGWSRAHRLRREGR
jgi:phosphatidylserine decarboxylase